MSTTWNGATGATVGVHPGLLDAPARGVGFGLGLAYLLPQFPSYGALATDLGPAYRLEWSPNDLLLATGGSVTALAGGDSDVTGGGSGAVYAGVGLIRRLVGPLGLRLDLTPRAWFTEDTTTVTFGGSAGLIWPTELVGGPRGADPLPSPSRALSSSSLCHGADLAGEATTPRFMGGVSSPLVSFP